MAEALVESLSADFDPSKYHDEYREQVLDLIERKAAGEEFETAGPSRPRRRQVVDLMAALEASVKAAKDARRRHPAGGPNERRRPTKESATAAKVPAKTRSAPVKRSVVSHEVGGTSVEHRRARAVAVATSTRCCTRRPASPRPR